MVSSFKKNANSARLLSVDARTFYIVAIKQTIPCTVQYQWSTFVFLRVEYWSTNLIGKQVFSLGEKEQRTNEEDNK